MKGVFVALAFAIAVIAASVFLEPVSPHRCDATSPHGPRIAGAIQIVGCP